MVLLLKTLGFITGDLWNLFLKGWPVLLIVSGLDGIYRRDGVAGSVAWAGLGVILLLANLGYLPPIYWDVIGRIWPFMLVVWGLDLLLGRKGWLSAGLGLVAGLIVVALLYWVIYSSPFSPVLETRTFEVPVQEAEEASVKIELVAGRLALQGGSAAENLADGEVQVNADDNVITDYSVENGVGSLEIKSDEDDFRYWFPGVNTERAWAVNLSQDLPLDLETDLVVGEQTVDLTGLQIDDLSADIVIGRSTMTLPADASGVLDVGMVIGDLVVYIPQDVPVSIQLETVITSLDYPDDFERSDDRLVSAGGEAGDALQIILRSVIGSVRIRYTD